MVYGYAVTEQKSHAQQDCCTVWGVLDSLTEDPGEFGV